MFLQLVFELNLKDLVQKSHGNQYLEVFLLLSSILKNRMDWVYGLYVKHSQCLNITRILASSVVNVIYGHA